MNRILHLHMLFAVFHLFNVHQKNPTEQLRFQIILGLYKEFRFNILAAHFIKAYNLLPLIHDCYLKTLNQIRI